MDHFAGFDPLLALGLGRVRRLVLWGGPGFVDQVEHKLRAYTWNVVHRYELPMAIEAHALGADGSRVHARFDSLQRFERRDDACERGRRAPSPTLLHDEALFAVRAPRRRPRDAGAGLRASRRRRSCASPPSASRRMGLATGAWLRDAEAGGPGRVRPTRRRSSWPGATAHGEHAERRTVGELRPLVLDTVPGRRIGYVTDLRYTEDNVERLAAAARRRRPAVHRGGVPRRGSRACAAQEPPDRAARPARSRAGWARGRWCRSTSRRATAAARTHCEGRC